MRATELYFWCVFERFQSLQVFKHYVVTHDRESGLCMAVTIGKEFNISGVSYTISKLKYDTVLQIEVRGSISLWVRFCLDGHCYSFSNNFDLLRVRRGFDSGTYVRLQGDHCDLCLFSDF